MSAIIANPLGANQQITTFVTGLDADGIEIKYWQQVASFRANAAIVAGQALNYVPPTALNPPSVTPMAAATLGRLFAGVSDNAAPAGGTVKVVTRGFCRALISTVPAAGDALLQPATTGSFTSSAVAFDATTVAGATFGIAMGIKDTPGRGLVYIDHK